MKVLLQSIKKRRKEIQRIMDAQKDKKINDAEAAALIKYHQRHIEEDIKRVQPFLDSLSKQPHLQYFINNYYFSNEYVSEKSNAKSNAKDNNITNAEAYYDTHFMQDGLPCCTCRKAVERIADRWHD